jgi:3-oxoacyl-[acyl-carrier-protein] synthase III
LQKRQAQFQQQTPQINLTNEEIDQMIISWGFKVGEKFGLNQVQETFQKKLQDQKLTNEELNRLNLEYQILIAIANKMNSMEPKKV